VARFRLLELAYMLYSLYGHIWSFLLAGHMELFQASLPRTPSKFRNSSKTAFLEDRGGHLANPAKVLNSYFERDLMIFERAT
jgi:hypothetical protein